MANQNKNHCVYLLISNKPYIGQTNNFKSTWNRHNNFKNKYPIACAIRKYGKENIKIKILHNELTQAQANIWETIEIANYNSFANGYNLTFGGYGKSEYKASVKTKN